MIGQLQGRHISPYCLFLEALINRINGQNIENASNILREFLLEYISDNQATLAALDDYINLTKQKFRNYTFSTTQRECVSTAMKAGIKLSEIDIADDKIDSLKLALGEEGYVALRKAIAANDRLVTSGITIEKTRNQLKQGNVAIDQELLLETIKGALTILNKMEMVSFEGVGKKLKEDLGKEGNETKKIMDKLRSKKEDSDYYDSLGQMFLVDKISSDMYSLFDFPEKEIKCFWESKWAEIKNKNWEHEWIRNHPIEKAKKNSGEYLRLRRNDLDAYLEQKWDEEASDLEVEKNTMIESQTAKYFIICLQRQIKLVCDASPVVSELFRDDAMQQEVLTGFLDKVKQHAGWEASTPEVSVKDFVQDLSSESGRYQLNSEFDTHISGSLRDVVNQMERDIKNNEKRRQSEKFEGYFTKATTELPNVSKSSSSLPLM